MKLKKCYIENFGVLSGCTFDFDHGVTVLKQDNGFGKTTLAAFIKAMFFGLPKTTKRSLEENEREKYRPWQGGKYGGFLEFEANGKSYRVERFFAARGSDSFRLYDLSHNGESNDFSQRLGEELFGVDAAAYEKSTFLPQKEVSLGMTGSLHAKIGNLVDDTDDLNNFESACAILEKASRRYALKRGEGGLIFETRRKLTESTFALQQCEESFQRAQQLSLREKELEEELFSLRKKADEYAVLQRKRQEQRLKLEQWEHYQSLLTRGEKAKEKYHRQVAFCGGVLPNGGELQLALEQLTELEQLKNQQTAAASAELTELTAFFKNGLPDDEELEVLRPYCSEYAFKTEKLAELSAKPAAEDQFFREGVPEKSQYEPLLADGPKLTAAILPLALGAVLLILGGAMLTGNLIASVIGMAAGIAAMGIGGVFLAKRQRFLKAQREFLLRYFSDVSDPKQCVREFFSRLQQREQRQKEAEERFRQKEALQQEIQQQKEILSHFFQKYYEEINEDFSALAEDLSRRVMEYRLLSRQQAKENEADLLRMQRIDDLTTQITAFCKRYGQPANTPKASLQLLTEAASAAKSLLTEATAALTEAEEYRQEKGLLEKPQPVREEEQESELTSSLAALSDEKTKLKLERSQLMAKAEPMQDLKTTITALQEQLQQQQSAHFCVNEALSLLQKAKENLSGKYVNVMQRRLNEYLAQLDPEFSGVSVDKELNITLERYGEKKRFGYFSKGYQNLLEICLRMALIDAMYQQEQPFLILDDPFINLDDQKILRAKEMLYRLGKTRQIIYLTCHSSRVL